MPVCFGVAPALVLSALVHAGALALLTGTGLALGLRWPYWIGVGLAAAVLVYQHSLVTPSDLSRLNVAFLTFNGLVSVLVFGFAWFSLLV